MFMADKLDHTKRDQDHGRGQGEQLPSRSEGSSPWWGGQGAKHIVTYATLFSLSETH